MNGGKQYTDRLLELWKKPVYEHGTGCGGQGTGERLAIKPVSSRLEEGIRKFVCGVITLR